MLDTKATNEGVDNSDEEDKAEDEVIEDFGAVLAALVIHVHSTDYQEQDAHDYLKSLHFITGQNRTITVK